MTMKFDGSRLVSLRGVMALTAVFALVNMVIRRMAGTSLAMDDAKASLFTQAWQWGYQPDNPPLYEWTVMALRGIGVQGLLSFLLIKYICLVLAAGGVFIIVRRYATAQVAFGTALGLVLLYQIGWNFHQAFTHSALLVVGAVVMLGAGLAWVRAPGAKSAALFGLAVGVALLTKYNAALLLIGFFGAIALDRRERGVLLRPSILFIPLVACVVMLPHALWFVDQSAAYKDSLDATLGLGGTYLDRVLGGAETLVISVATFFLPWGLVAWWMKRGQTLSLTDEERLMVRTSAGALALLAVAVFGLGIANVSERYLIPVLLPAYLGWTSALLRAVSVRRFKVWIWACAGFALIVILVRAAGFLFPGPPFCEKCRHFVPYSALEAPIAAMVPEGTILFVREENTAGNLVPFFPQSPVRGLTSVHLINPIKEGPIRDGQRRPCLLVWSEDTVGGVPLESVFAYAYDDPRTVMVTAPWQHMFKPDGWRTTSWGLTPITDDRLYAEFCTSVK